MMRTLRALIGLVPWLLVIGLCIWVYMLSNSADQPKTTVKQDAILQSIEAMGKIELVKYNFKEITEVKQLSKEYFRIFKLGPDSKIALISTGSAVGCLDLTKVTPEDVVNSDTAIYINLPAPELCHYKLDMEKTRIFSLQTNPMIDEKQFIQKAYRYAERDIKKAALDAGIQQQVEQNAETILKPILENLTGKKVYFTHRPQRVQLDPVK